MFYSDKGMGEREKGQRKISRFFKSLNNLMTRDKTVPHLTS